MEPVQGAHNEIPRGKYGLSITLRYVLRAPVGNIIPIGSMYDTFTYIYHTNQLNVGKYTI